MATTIPRAEIDAIAKRYYGIEAELDVDPPTGWARTVAAHLRESSKADADPDSLLTEADDLDALADRYEREAS